MMAPWIHFPVFFGGADRSGRWVRTDPARRFASGGEAGLRRTLEARDPSLGEVFSFLLTLQFLPPQGQLGKLP